MPHAVLVERMHPGVLIHFRPELIGAERTQVCLDLETGDLHTAVQRRAGQMVMIGNVELVPGPEHRGHGMRRQKILLRLGRERSEVFSLLLDLEQSDRDLALDADYRWMLAGLWT